MVTILLHMCCACVLSQVWLFETLSCLLRNLHADQEATVGTGHGTMGWIQIGKGVPQVCILSPCLFNLYAEYMWNAKLDEAQAGIKIARRNISKLRYADDTTLTEESEEPLDEHESGEWKSWLKTQHLKNEDHGIQSHQFMANRYGKMKTVTDFIFLGSKITAAISHTCSLEEKLWQNCTAY